MDYVRMQKITYVLLLALFVPVVALFQGCSRGDAAGKLQVMYSGNIRGNVAPCG